MARLFHCKDSLETGLHGLEYWLKGSRFSYIVRLGRGDIPASSYCNKSKDDDDVEAVSKDEPARDGFEHHFCSCALALSSLKAGYHPSSTRTPDAVTCERRVFPNMEAKDA